MGDGDGMGHCQAGGVPAQQHRGRLVAGKPAGILELAAVHRDLRGHRGGMATDHVVRFNPKTGQNVEYMMPKDTNMRTVFIDNSTNPVTFWVGSNHDAALVKVEPLD